MTVVVRADIDDAIRQAIGAVAPEADLVGVDPDARLRETLDLDSLDFLNIIERLYVLTGVSIPEDDYRVIDTWRKLSGYLAARVPG